MRTTYGQIYISIHLVRLTELIEEMAPEHTRVLTPKFNSKSKFTLPSEQSGNTQEQEANSQENNEDPLGTLSAVP